MASGVFVALEGIDGAGTTTQRDWLANALRGRGHEVFVTHEPSRGNIGQLLRAQLRAQPGRNLGESPLGEAQLALLFAADRLSHLQQDILPALHRGAVVVCDRYVWSSYAYQGSVLPARWVRHINGHARPADCTLLLRIPLALAQSRRQQRAQAEERFDGDERQKAAARRYETLLRRAPTGQALAVDASASIEEVGTQLLAALTQLAPALGLGARHAP